MSGKGYITEEKEYVMRCVIVFNILGKKDGKNKEGETQKSHDVDVKPSL